ncbi:MAG: hypothetical protein K1W16_01520 [Lachnospiraceae bacterium]
MTKRTIISRLIAVISFFVLISLVLMVTNEIVCAKFIGDSTTIVKGFYAEKKNDIDLIVIGSSNSFCTIDPIVLYEEYGITAYDFGSSSQPMNISVLYLKEAFRRQKPKVVALEVNMMVGGGIHTINEAGLRWGLTNIPFSIDKLKCIYQSVGAVNAEYFSYVFPTFRYHSRWKELSKLDYTYFYQDKTNYTKGYLETQSVSETAINLQEYLFDGEAWIEEENIRYLDEIVNLCKKNNVELLLFKSPKENWHCYETEAIQALADARGVRFVDYNELYQNGVVELDLTADFRDEEHLNDFGARKVTSHLGQYLKENYALPDRRTDTQPNAWDMASMYRERKEWKEYMEATTARECLELLQEDKNFILVVTDTKAGTGKETRQWVYEDCKIALDITWKEEGIRHRKAGKSELVLARIGKGNQVLIDGINHYQMGGRWNIIVYDKILNSVTASLVFPE